MAYNPRGVDRSGEILAAGFRGGLANMMAGIEQHRRNKEKKESEEAAASWLKKNAQKFGLPIDTSDDGEIKEAIKAAGGGTQALTLMTGLQEHAERQKVLRAQEARERAAIAQMEAAQQMQAQNHAALRAAVAPVPNENFAAQGGYVLNAANRPAANRMPGGGEMLQKFVGANGTDPELARLLLAAAEKPARKLEAIPLKDEGGNTVNFAWDGASAPQRIGKTPVAAKPLSAPGKLLADAKLLEANGDTENAKLLRAIAAKQGEDKPMSLTDYLISGGSAEEYRQYVESFKSRNRTADTESGAGLSGQDRVAFDWAKANPQDPRAKKILAKLGVK